MSDTLEAAAKRLVIQAMQLKDFGHEGTGGEFWTNASKTALLEECAENAARAVLDLVTPGKAPAAAGPYAHEYGKTNGDGTFSVVIERGEPKNPVPDWPVKALYASPVDHPEVDAPVAWQNIAAPYSILTPEQYGMRLPLMQGKFRPLYASPAPVTAVAPHSDDAAVDRFAAAMKAKLSKKRAEGRGGWDGPDCSAQILSDLMRTHVDKGDPVDVGNLAMMLQQRGERII
ncbi:hypothetical protein X766_16035 [Mesorhizobium sp. LSJC255A00]|uniref:hypothetical protein n=1 Tax=Mesorhizobium sp. LSJC255A00 TaxID=1287313 RepID=UPI0003CF2F66|nr:hypothetical protein [Mesorhizobium sp. LSJC255A00]ESX17540.1 hypothetical protein X766_16035 [Mesorhizobium sp. LSJC255A00]